MPTIAFAGQKGGAGKTTLAFCLADEISKRGESVLLVDADPQGTAQTWAAVADEAEIEGRPHTVAMSELHKPSQLPKVGASFDWVIIDCPGRSDQIQRSALMVTDLVVLPCGPSPLDAWALAESLELVEAAKKQRPSLRSVVVVNRVNARTSLGAGARGNLVDSGLNVAQSVVGIRTAFAESPAFGMGVTRFAPRSKAATEFRALATELMGLAKGGKWKHGRK